MNRLSSHEQNERRREAKKRQKASRRARVIHRMTAEDKKRQHEQKALDERIRGLQQFAGCRSADEYASVLRQKKALL